MSTEEILRQRLKEYRSLLELSFCFIKNLKLDDEELEQATKILKVMRDNGISGEQRPMVDRDDT